MASDVTLTTEVVLGEVQQEAAARLQPINSVICCAQLLNAILQLHIL